MENDLKIDQAVYDPSSLAHFFETLLFDPPKVVRRAWCVEAVRSSAESQLRDLGISTLDLLRAAAAREKSRINSANRSKGGGRSPSEARERLPGIDAVDAGVMLAICQRLRVLNKARLLALMARDAISAEQGALEAVGAKPLSPRDWEKLLGERERKLKSLFEEPPVKLKGAIAERTFDLPNDEAGLKEALRAISARLWPVEAI